MIILAVKAVFVAAKMASQTGCRVCPLNDIATAVPKV
jgi:hypothetical protein